MAQADPALITSRRTLLAGAITATTLLPAAALAASPGGDATLIGLGRELSATWATERSVCKRFEDIDNDEANAAVEAAVARTSDVVQRILRQQARTIEGIKVKTSAISWCWGGRIDFDTETTDMKLVQSVLTDLLAMQGA
jgi:hypothetical protein